MAETLGSLCDKLTIIKLKQYHTDSTEKKINLKKQENELINEMNTFLADAVSGNIPINKLTFASNKVYKKNGNETRIIQGKIAEVFSKLAEINCELWHEQEKVYEFEKVPLKDKDNIIKKLAILNLERNQCMDIINNTLKENIMHFNK